MHTIDDILRTKDALRDIHATLTTQCRKAYRMASRCPTVGRAMYEYKGTMSYELNAHLRADHPLNKYPHLKAMDSSLVRALACQSWTSDVILYRSVFGEHARELSDLSIGMHFCNKGYSSFTYNPAIALSFSTSNGEAQAIMVLDGRESCKGKPFLYMDGVREALLHKRYIRQSACTGAGWVEQAEVLLPSGVVFEVLRKRVTHSKHGNPVTVIHIR